MPSEEIESLLHREHLKLADPKKRAMAFLIDELLLSVLLMVVLWDQFAAAVSMEELINVTNTFVLEFMLIKVIYQTFFVMQYGATLGKIAMKIRVYELRTMDAPSLLCALNRAVFRVVGELLFYLGFVWGLLDPFKRTWHDRSAQTLVVDA
ncbi:MAG: RDD family protein [Campylobacterales bacterium]|nr:RDD family protein [Campylobacterales bacterium]